MPTINSSWPRHCTAYVGLKGQAGRVVMGVFIQLAHRNATLNRRLETELWVMWICVQCACVQAVNIIYSTLLYDCDFLWHPQLSLHRITNFAVTFSRKLDSGDNIRTEVSYICSELQRIHIEYEAEGTSCAQTTMHRRTRVFTFSQNYTVSPVSERHIIPDCLINTSPKDLQERLLYACKLRERRGGCDSCQCNTKALQ